MSFLKELAALSLGGAALGLLVYILRRILGRRLPSAFYYYAWVLVLLRMVLPLPGLLVLRALDRDQELSCDEKILRDMEPSRRRSYARTLLSLAEDQAGFARPLATSFSTERENLKERSCQIMRYKKPGLSGLILALAAAVLLCGCSAALGPQGDAPAADASPAASFAPVTPTPSPTPQVELRQVTVSNVDELLAAIAPYTAITLEPGDYDLTQASDYGLSQTDSIYYRWDTVFDGYELVLSGLEGLQFLGSGAEEARILTQPRYADVLSFESCRELFISDLTLGHSPDQGECVGGVLNMAAVDSAIVSQCSLFGCGIWGITASNCWDVEVESTEIYECSRGDLNLTGCHDMSFNDCNFHHNGGFRYISNCTNMTMDGGPIPSLRLDLEALGAVLDEGLLSAGDDPLRVGLDSFPLISINLPQGQPLTFEATVPGQNQILESPASVTWSLTGQGSDQVELYEWSSNRVTLTNEGLTGGSLSLTAELDGESYTVTIYPSP